MLYSVKGVERATGGGVHVQIEAADENAAGQAARDRGIDVQTVSAAGLIPESPPSLNYLSPRQHEGIALRTRWFTVAIFMGSEALILISILVVMAIAISGSDIGALAIGGVIAGAALFTIQLGMLMPVLRPRPSFDTRKSPWEWLGAIFVGLLLGVCFLSALWLAADLHFSLNQSVSVSDRDSLAVISLYVAGGFWLISIPLVVAFMRRGRPESVLAKLSAMLFLGSIVEFIAGIPIVSLAQKRESCTCANASFFSMVISTMAAFIVLGPMIFLIILARRTRAASRGCCAACGFDMRQLANRDQCPQCGAGWKVAAG